LDAAFAVDFPDLDDADFADLPDEDFASALDCFRDWAIRTVFHPTPAFHRQKRSAALR
jgi:hypothetical protein